MKIITATLFLTLATTSSATSFFPGSTLEILEDAKAVKIEDGRIADPLLHYAIFSEGKNLMTAPAYGANTQFCLIEKVSQTSSLKGIFYYNGFSFTQFDDDTKSLNISCFKTRFNSDNLNYVPEAVILDENFITRALGDYADLRITSLETLKIGNFTFRTGSQLGQEIYGPKKCSLHTFKVGPQIKMHFAGGHSSCLMNVESSSLQNTDLGLALKVQGKGIFIGVPTECWLEFEVNDGKLTGRALQNIQYNSSGSYCQY